MLPIVAARPFGSRRDAPRDILLTLVALFVVAACGSPAAKARAPEPPTAAIKAMPPAAPQPPDELDVPLPLDQRITHGKLPNGLSYYVLPHKKPEKRAQLWLAVNAGSVLEDDDQRGLAHFVEHMGFNGTKRFPKQDLVDLFERSGVRFGADLNAYTSFDETVYQLQVPTDDSELVTRGLSVLRDWADGVTFDPVEVDKERGVVLEEWRLGRGAWKRVFDKQAPVLFFGSKYADRITIGLPEIIQGAPRDTLVRYYRDWYRPDLMAVVAVGDFDAADMVARIEKEFGTLASAAASRPSRPTVALPSHEQTLVSIETDPEMPTSSVAIVSKLPHRPESSARDFRRRTAERLYHTMLNARLDELTRLPDAPFLSAFSSTSTFVRTADAFIQWASVKEGAAPRGFASLLEEVLRVERHGFTAPEFERAKHELLRQQQEAAKERDKKDGRGYATEIVNTFLQEDAMPGAEAELALLERFLPTYTLEELDALSKRLGAGSRVILVSGPAKMAKPTAETMLAISRDVSGRDIKAYDDRGPNVPLMSTKPSPAAVVLTTTIADIGVTEWKLGNGVRVVVKPTDFRNDEIRMSAFSPGGHSLVKDADYDSARFADTVVAEGGLGPFDAVTLKKSLEGKIASVTPFIRELEEGLSGHASPTDLELLLQMTSLWFTGPRRDASAFDAWRAREAESIRNRRLSPEMSFFEDLTSFSSQDHLRRRPVTAEIVEKVDLDKAMSIYKDRFADAGDFTFVFVGNIDVDRLKPLVETYLGSLPAHGRKETWRDVKVFPPPGVKTKIVQKGTEPKSFVAMMFHGTERWSREAENDMRTLGDVLRIRLRELLREEMGGVYGVFVNGDISRRPRQEFMFQLFYGCSPENVDKLEQAIFDEAKAIQTKGIGSDYLTKVKEQRRRTHELDLKDNGFWERELVRAYTFGDDPRLIPDIAPMLDLITSDRVRAAARKYLPQKQYVLGVLKPESAAPGNAPKPASP